jgi:hypothetical protein
VAVNFFYKDCISNGFIFSCEQKGPAQNDRKGGKEDKSLDKYALKQYMTKSNSPQKPNGYWRIKKEGTL